MNKEKRISKGFWVWGQFDSASTSKIEEIYQKINDTLNGPTFDIHLTLSGPILELEEGHKLKLNDLSQSLSSFRLQLNGPGIKDQFFQSLFINVHITDDLVNLKSRIDTELNLETKKYFPHVSLYYGNAEKHVKEKLTNEIEFPEKVLLDKVSLVRVDENIKSWEILHSYPLSSSK